MPVLESCSGIPLNTQNPLALIVMALFLSFSVSFSFGVSLSAQHLIIYKNVFFFSICAHHSEIRFYHIYRIVDALFSCIVCFELDAFRRTHKTHTRTLAVPIPAQSNSVERHFKRFKLCAFKWRSIHDTNLYTILVVSFLLVLLLLSLYSSAFCSETI